MSRGSGGSRKPKIFEPAINKLTVSVDTCSFLNQDGRRGNPKKSEFLHESSARFNVFHAVESAVSVVNHPILTPLSPLLRTTEYRRLRQIAQRLVRRESECTLTGTGLVHELFIRDRSSAGRGVFQQSLVQIPLAIRMMKHILIDRARKRRTRLMSQQSSLVGVRLSAHDQASLFVADLDEHIAQLEAVMPENANLVRLHLYSELSLDEAADQLGISRSTAYRKWNFCKVWLASRLRRN